MTKGALLTQQNVVLCFSGRDAMRQSVAAASMVLVPAVQAYLRELMPVAGA